jgi:hypothetical protein
LPFFPQRWFIDAELFGCPDASDKHFHVHFNPICQLTQVGSFPSLRLSDLVFALKDSFVYSAIGQPPTTNIPRKTCYFCGYSMSFCEMDNKSYFKWLLNIDHGARK